MVYVNFNYRLGVLGSLGLPEKVMVPMHVGISAAAAGGPFRLGTMDDFLKVLDPATKIVQAGHTMTLTAGKLPAEFTVMVMKYE